MSLSSTQKIFVRVFVLFSVVTVALSVGLIVGSFFPYFNSSSEMRTLGVTLLAYVLGIWTPTPSYSRKRRLSSHPLPGPQGPVPGKDSPRSPQPSLPDDWQFFNAGSASTDSGSGNENGGPRAKAVGEVRFGPANILLPPPAPGSPFRAPPVALKPARRHSLAEMPRSIRRDSICTVQESTPSFSESSGEKTPSPEGSPQRTTGEA